MGTADLLADKDVATYRVHDLIADIFDVEVNDAQVEKIYTLYPKWKNKLACLRLWVWQMIFVNIL